MLKYHQKSSESCCLINLESAFRSIGDNRSMADLVDLIEESLALYTNRFRNRIYFANNIMKKNF